MIKKQQKWIALLVTLTFMWLLQVSTMPVAAANTAEQVSSANNEQGPRFIEEEGYSGYQAKKKSILPIVLIGVSVVAVAAVLFLVVLKTKYDIVGNWDYSWKDTGDTSWVGTGQSLVFSGDKKSKSGALTYYGSHPGTYSVDGKNVTFVFSYNANEKVTHTGQFDSKDKMSGTWVYTYNNALQGIDGTWEAVRATTTAQSGNLQQHGDKPGKTKK
jgi:hypothetical protein